LRRLRRRSDCIRLQLSLGVIPTTTAR
jgi:hypothetical protein